MADSNEIISAIARPPLVADNDGADDINML